MPSTHASGRTEFEVARITQNPSPRRVTFLSSHYLATKGRVERAFHLLFRLSQASVASRLTDYCLLRVLYADSNTSLARQKFGSMFRCSPRCLYAAVRRCPCYDKGKKSLQKYPKSGKSILNCGRWVCRVIALKNSKYSGCSSTRRASEPDGLTCYFVRTV